MTDVAIPRFRPRSGARRWPGWLALVALPLLAWTLRARLPAWAFMWLLAAAIFSGCSRGNLRWVGNLVAPVGGWT